MVLNLVSPFLAPEWAPRALAATETYNFSNPSRYTWQHNVVEDGHAQFRLNFALSDDNFGTSGIELSDLVQYTGELEEASPPSSRMLFRVDGDVYDCPIDCDGSTWTQTLGTSETIQDIAGTLFNNAFGFQTQFAVAVGSDGGIGVIQYSSDGGSTWDNATTPDFAGDGITSVDHVAFKPNTETAVAVLNDGQTVISTDAGANWAYDSDTGLGGAVSEFTWDADDDMILLGTTAGEVWQSVDDGTTWSKVDGLAGAGPPEITEIAFSANYVYVAGEDFMFRGALASNLDLEDSWLNVGLNVSPGGAGPEWTAIDSFHFTSSGIVLASLSRQTTDPGSSPFLISSADNGLSWTYVAISPQQNTAGMGIARADLETTDDFVWIVRDAGGNLDSLVTDIYQNNGWIVTLDGISASKINSIVPTFSSSSETTEIKLAFGFTNDQTQTWYYYNGASWVSGNGNNSNFATLDSLLTSQVLQSFDEEVEITGPIYTKIYFVDETFAPPLVVLENLDINYNSAGEGNGDPDAAINDKIPPISTVVALKPSYNELPFPVSVFALDAHSGIDFVNLYYTKSQPADSASDLLTFGASKHGCPLECFTWDFTAPLGDGNYYFYSSATDKAGNTNYTQKFLSIPAVEAQTLVDTGAPYVVSNSPLQDSEHNPITGTIQIRMSEPVNTATLEYGLFKLQNGTKTNATNKLGTVEWLPTFYDGPCPQGADCIGDIRYDIEFRVPYSALDNDSNYYFVIRQLKDYAGNGLTTNYLEQPENQLVWALHFETVAVINPDLTQSKIEVTNVPPTGKFNTGDKVSFKVTLKNASDTVSLTTLTLPIVEGLSYCSTAPCVPAASTSGQQPLVIQDEDGTTITWTGNVTKGTDVVVTFDTRVVTPAQSLVLTQTAEIDDGLHDEIYIKSVDVLIQENANFSASSKTGTCFWQDETQTCTDAVVGTSITYTVTVTNTGTTVATRTVMDSLGSNLDFVAGPTGSGWTSLAYDESADAIVGAASFAPGISKTFVFTATFTPAAAGLNVTNVADISDWSPDPSFTTSVPGISLPDEFSPEIVEQSPADKEGGVSENAPIVVAFSKSIDISTFGFTLSRDGELVDLTGFTVAWDSHNGNLTSRATITHPKLPFDLAASYKMQVNATTQDTQGNVLAAGALPNPWTWTIADPVVVISAPSERVVKVGVNKVSPEFVISIQDQSTGKPYIVAADTPIGLLAEIPGSGKLGQKRRVSTTSLFAAGPNGPFEPSSELKIFHVTVGAGKHTAGFYFKDSVANLVNIIAFPDPWNGWSAADKTVLVTDEELDDKIARLVFDVSSTNIAVGKFSKPITIRAEGGEDDLRLPDRLYFYTESTTGAFYNEDFEKLNQYITIQANPSTNLQFADVSGDEAVFYYMDPVAQSSLVIVSDNAPLAPDTAMANATAVMTVTNFLEEEEILEELVPIEDETGRELATVEIDPTQAVLLPGGIKSFAARALDAEGKEIENAEFRWYVIAGGGSIEKEGINDNSHESVFTAGEELGSFYDTIIVATLYNGEFGYATASIRVSDVVEYDGPTGLPTTGVSSLQVIFTILTLTAAVALAWVEHYDKTHFAKGK